MAHDTGELERLRSGIRARITMAEVCAKDGLQKTRREGNAVRACCPFHEEKSGSFLIGGRDPHKAHCFGCGKSWDIFDYWQKRHGVATHVEAVNQLASLVGLSPVIPGVQWVQPKAKAMVTARGGKRVEAGVKPAMPRLRQLRPEELQELADLRGLSVAAVRVAAYTYKRVAGSLWPLWHNRRENSWMSPCDEHFFKCKMDGPNCRRRERFACWVVTDESRWVAQFRRLDGGLFQPQKNRGATAMKAHFGYDGESEVEAAPGFKSWTVGTATWPIGCSEIGNRTNVIFVEGGADMLASYHFLYLFGKLNSVAVVCMLGVSYIAEPALAFFRGKRVCIIADNDEEQIKTSKDKGGNEVVKKSRPGADAAARWTEQLTAAGAAVKTFSLGAVWQGGVLVAPEMVTRDGKRVKDLNECVGCSPEVIHEDLRDAFCEWKEGFGG